MSIDEVKEMIRVRLADEREVRKHRHAYGEPMLPWSNGYVMALIQVLEDIEKAEECEDSLRGVG